jgi:hypothetical protein
MDTRRALAAPIGLELKVRQRLGSKTYLAQYRGAIDLKLPGVRRSIVENRGSSSTFSTFGSWPGEEIEPPRYIQATPADDFSLTRRAELCSLPPSR